MIVDYLNIFRSRIRSPKAYAIPIVDADAVLPKAVALEGFKPVSRRYAQIIELRCNFQLPQLTACRSLAWHKPSHANTMCQLLGITVFE